jgi:ABC-type transporter MlaC component
MKTKSLVWSVLGVAALALSLTAPNQSSGQAAGDDAAVAALLAEITTQQTAIADNQTKIDEKFASIAEHVRQARLFVSRGGGGGGGAAK